MTGELRILVVGAGATGGYFGGRLAAAGADVTFLVRAGRAAQLEQDGLQIRSPHGDLRLQPQLITAAQLSGPFDLILLTVKAYGLDRVMDDIAPAVGGQTLILPVLNGLRHVDRLVERFGVARVLGGVCVVSTTVDEQGRIVQLAEMQTLTYGHLDGTVSSALGAVHNRLQGSGFTAKLSRHILPAMWQKWAMLASLGAYNCLLRGTVGEILAVPGGAEVADALLAETASVAAAAGHPLLDAGRQAIATLMTTPGSGFSSSMYRDLLAGRPVEADALIGDLVDRAERLDVPTPLLRLALVHLSVYQARLG